MAVSFIGGGNHSTLSHNVAFRLSRIRTHNISGDRHWLHGSCKSNYHMITATTAPHIDKKWITNLQMGITIWITHSWEGGRADCYPEKFHCEPKPRLTMIFLGVTICSTALSAMCYLFYYTECSFLLISFFFMILMPWISIAVVFKCVKLWYWWCVTNKITYIFCIC